MKLKLHRYLFIVHNTVNVFYNWKLLRISILLQVKQIYWVVLEEPWRMRESVVFYFIYGIYSVIVLNRLPFETHKLPDLQDNTLFLPKRKYMKSDL